MRAAATAGRGGEPSPSDLQLLGLRDQILLDSSRDENGARLERQMCDSCRVTSSSGTVWWALVESVDQRAAYLSVSLLATGLSPPSSLLPLNSKWTFTKCTVHHYTGSPESLYSSFVVNKLDRIVVSAWLLRPYHPLSRTS